MNERKDNYDHLSETLSRAGLNLTAVFPLDSLPAGIHHKLIVAVGEGIYKQLILVAHAGNGFWQSLQDSDPHPVDPVDKYTREIVTQAFDEILQGRRYSVLYPGELRLDLQALGALAGWHHASPFWVGINPDYGTWYAYRALIVADSDFAPTPTEQSSHPCVDCAAKPCIQACPAHAMQNDRFDIDRCIGYRLQPDSACRYQCLARNACPVGSQHRYDDAQMRHHYSASLKFLEAHTRNHR